MIFEDFGRFILIGRSERPKVIESRKRNTEQIRFASSMTLASSYRQTARCLGRCTDLYSDATAAFVVCVRHLYCTAVHQEADNAFFSLNAQHSCVWAEVDWPLLFA